MLLLQSSVYSKNGLWIKRPQRLSSKNISSYLLQFLNCIKFILNHLYYNYNDQVKEGEIDK
jgi:hypothetical protein